MGPKKGRDVGPCDGRAVGHRGGGRPSPGLSSFLRSDRIRALPRLGNVITQRYHQRAGYPHGIDRIYWGCEAFSSAQPGLLALLPL